MFKQILSNIWIKTLIKKNCAYGHLIYVDICTENFKKWPPTSIIYFQIATRNHLHDVDDTSIPSGRNRVHGHKKKISLRI